MFAGTLLAIPVLMAAVLADRDLSVRMPVPLRRVLFWSGVGVLATSWALKLTVLPN
jgi:hypothetical protein